MGVTGCIHDLHESSASMRRVPRVLHGGELGKLLVFLGATAGSAIGWWMGAFVGGVTAFVLSSVGTGVGIYYARRFNREYLP